MEKVPDEILVFILSKLTLKEAARTSVLSHTWENLWMYSTGSLNFDPGDVLRGRIELSCERPRFKDWVNQILNLHRGRTVDEFRVRFDLYDTDGDDIEKWVKFAVEKGVCKFELDFSEFDGYIKWCDCYLFPSKLLGGSPINVPRSFGSLVSLRLISVNLCDEVVAYFISNCQFLEHLCIKGASSLTNLNATTALKLKHLEVEYCDNLENVDILNTNIESVNFNCTMTTNLSFKKLPLLREVSLGDNWCICVLEGEFRLLPISQLQRLVLDIDDWYRIGQFKFPEVCPTFCNLKHLEVTLVAGYHQSIFCLTSLTCASPQLISFTLKMNYVPPSEQEPLFELPNCEWRKSEKCIHQCLKVVKFTGWYGYESDLDLVSYLITNSPVLEKVIIDPKVGPFPKIFASSAEAEREERSRVSARLLIEKVRPGMEFVIL